jgi:VanZ family protein
VTSEGAPSFEEDEVRLATSRQMLIRVSVLMLIAAVGATLLFLVQGPTIASSRLTHRIWNLGHIGLFGTLTALTFWVFKERLQSANAWWVHGAVVGTVAIVGGAAEVIQTMFDREASLDDAWRNVVGACLATAFLCPARPLARRTRLILRLVAVTCLIIALFPVMRTANDEFLRYRQYPVLSDFTTRFERDRWVPTYGSRARISDKLEKETGRRALRVELGSQLYSGVGLSCPFGDFGPHENLRLHIWNDAAVPVDLVCRVNDLEHNNEWYDRFFESFELQPGWNDVAFGIDKIRESPRDRDMNMAEIRVLILFRPRPSLPRTIYIDKVWLE